MFPDDQFKAWVHTSIKYFKVDFSGDCTYLSSEIARIFPEKYPEYQRCRAYGNDMLDKHGSKSRVAEAE